MIRTVTADQIRVIVAQSLDSEVGRSLDALFSDAAFGGRSPELWRDWPDHLRRAWDYAVRLWGQQAKLQSKEYGRKRRKKLHGTIPAADAWRALAESSQLERVESRLTWGDIARRLGLGVRVAQRQVRDLLQFQFEGYSGTDRAPREVVAGPCLACGKVVPREYLEPGYYVCLSGGLVEPGECVPPENLLPTYRRAWRRT